MSWNKIRLGNIVGIKTGKLDANASSVDGAYPFFTCSKEPLKISTFSYDCECVLVAGNGDLNVKYYNGKFDAYQRTYIVECSDNTKLNARYLFHFLDTYLEKLRQQSIGGVIKYIKLENLTEIPIPLPPLATQKRIAEILDAADGLRRKDQELLKKYDELAQAIFIDMFGDPVNNEKGWDVNKGRDVVKVLGGAAFKSTDYKDDGIPLIRIGTINKGYFDKSQIVFLPYDFAISHERYIVKPKDLLITLTGTVGKDDYGNVYIMEDHFDQYLLNQRVAKLIVKQDYLMTRFFEFLLKQKEVKAELTGVSRGVRQANISNEDIYNLDVISPPLALQNDFVERINSVYGLIETSINSSLVSDIFFNSLIQKAFNGELVS